MNDVKPPNQLPSPPHNEPAKRKGRGPARRCLGGYVLNHKAAIKLGDALSGNTAPVVEGRYHFYSPRFIQDNIRKDLRSRGLNFRVDVDLSGDELPVDTIIATRGNYKFRGPLPMLVEGATEKPVREWLESKGNRPTSFVCHFPTLSAGITKEEYRWEVRID